MQKLNDALALGRDVLNHQHVPQFLLKPLLELLDRLDELLALDWFDGVAHCPHLESLLGVLQCRNHVDRDVARPWVALQVLQDREPGTVRQVDVEQHGAREELFRQANTLGCGGRH